MNAQPAETPLGLVALRLVVFVAVIAWVGACVDERRVAGHEESQAVPWPGIVSDPAAVGSSAALALGATSGTDVVYISLAPGTIPDGEVASIRNRVTGSGVVAAMVAGGLDPVPVSANAGDTLDIDVRLAGSDSTLHFVHAVAAARPPIIVRTDPPPRKRDVPLNAAMLVVFSEPIDPPTLTESAVQLRQGTSLVPGQLEFRDPANLTAAFVPAAPLATGTAYRLIVTQGIRDLDGEALEAPLTVDFTTEGGFPPPPPAAGMSQIAFWSGGIRVMDADGSNARQLTTVLTDYEPAWSPDGSKLVFTSDRANTFNGDIYVMNADGSGVRRLTAGPSHDYSPAWSPDGSRIAFQRDGYIYVVNAADGSGATSLAPGGCCSDMGPAWSPEGSKIAFDRDDGESSHIYVMNADGSAVTRLTSGSYRDISPAWSPDGSRLAFLRGGDIYVMDALDGSELTRLTTVVDGFGGPSWSPDGSMIAFGGYGGVAIVNADGSHVRRLSDGTSPAWSRLGSAPAEPAVRIMSVSGEGQIDTVRATLAERLVVRVLRNNAPVSGVTVSWSPAPGDGSDTFAPRTTVTDASGLASTTLTFGPQAGLRAVRAYVSGASPQPQAVFTVTAAPGTPVTLCDYCGAPVVGLANDTVPYLVVARDGHGLGGQGNVVPGVPVTWTITAGDGTISPVYDTTTIIPDTCSIPCSIAWHALGPREDTATVTAAAPSGANAGFTTRVVSALVDVPDYASEPFWPDTVVLPPGATVAWLWTGNSEDSPDHNVTFEDDPTQPASSATQGHHGDPFLRTFTGAPRTIRYRCTLHSTDFVNGEVGVVIVQ